MFYNKQCLGCAYNTNKYVDGCECFTEIPVGCRNYTIEEDKRKREKQMEYHKQRTLEQPKLKYVRLSGGSGKWVLTNTY